ncbi:ABC transporter permease [Amaricoccus macauensis]|uniref:ABC transporter permease n=1 Tax=Amaricoccus macauensis TaxID=57001 RepID=UPI003C7D568C
MRGRFGGVAGRFDRMGVLVSGLTVIALALPFASFSPNRILPGEANWFWSALGLPGAAGLLLVAAGTVAVALRPPSLYLRLAASLVAILALLLLAGRAGTVLIPPDNPYARVSPAAGFWVMLTALLLLMTDTLSRMQPRPALRLVLLALVSGGLAAVLASGAWDELSILKEYGSRADAFWREGRQHVALAFGSLGAAALAGIPLGILCHRRAKLAQPILNGLTIVQTIPSIALFGLLIVPLAWVAANIPGAQAIGISGIGAAPALVALFAYSLLPVVSNTVAGLAGVPASVRDAATGMGMTDRQRLWRVELPLAFPVILTGIRIVLVQNIGLATIAALIGGGGFGVFVFQGMGQTATDLILLGALPTVLLAFAAAIVLDALVEWSKGRGTERTT